jgi:hypothetical protein
MSLYLLFSRYSPLVLRVDAQAAQWDYASLRYGADSDGQRQNALLADTAEPAPLNPLLQANGGTANSVSQED